MSRVQVRLPRDDRGTIQEIEGPKMLIATDDGVVELRVPYSPTEIEHTNLAPTFGEIVRTADRRPILIRTQTTLRKMSFTLFFGNELGQAVGDPLRVLRKLAYAPRPLMVYYSGWDGDVAWRMTDFAHRDTLHDPITNDVIRSEAQVEFTEDSPVIYTPPPGGREVPPGHRVVQGDTLVFISRQYYGDESFWRAIGDANEIVDPRIELPPGAHIRLPPANSISPFDRRP